MFYWYNSFCNFTIITTYTNWYFFIWVFVIIYLVTLYQLAFIIIWFNNQICSCSNGIGITVDCRGLYDMGRVYYFSPLFITILNTKCLSITPPPTLPVSPLFFRNVLTLQKSQFHPLPITKQSSPLLNTISNTPNTTCPFNSFTCLLAFSCLLFVLSKHTFQTRWYNYKMKKL